jgi:hypothetical protein
MPELQITLQAKFKEAEALSSFIRQSGRDSEEQTEAIFRWAVVGDETTRLMLQAEEQLSSAQLARLKAEINGEGPRDMWSKYREAEWHLPKFGAPGPKDEPPPMVPIRNFF